MENRKWNIVMIMAAIIIIIISALWANSTLNKPEPLYNILAILRTTIINLSLFGSIIILFTYTKILLERRTDTIIALFITSLALLISSIILNPIIVFYWRGHVFGIGELIILKDFFLLVAIMTLVYVSRK
jgi:hypothetical protein